MLEYFKTSQSWGKHKLNFAMSNISIVLKHLEYKKISENIIEYDKNNINLLLNLYI